MRDVPVRRPATADDHAVLLRIWRRAVEATHDFLGADVVDLLQDQVRDDALPALDVTVAEIDGEPVGWIGMDGSHVEALFVDPAVHGRGVGTALLEGAAASHMNVTLDVNEQNPSARAFYLARGFIPTGRSPVDADGREFPLIHMRRDRRQAQRR
ncbi:GNAT family N-acetyltransferase [Pseudonocardia sediminis]|nr:GNAT family N-acetyltransferase [Pseudonocardia sediminis]